MREDARAATGEWRAALEEENERGGGAVVTHGFERDVHVIAARGRELGLAFAAEVGGVCEELGAAHADARAVTARDDGARERGDTHAAHAEIVPRLRGG